MNSKGQISAFITMFLATIVIVVILVGFVLGAGIVKKMNNAGAGVRIYDEESVEIDSIFDYMDRYVSLLKVRFYLESDLSLEESFEEGGYEK